MIILMLSFSKSLALWNKVYFDDAETQSRHFQISQVGLKSFFEKLSVFVTDSCGLRAEYKRGLLNLRASEACEQRCEPCESCESCESFLRVFVFLRLVQGLGGRGSFRTITKQSL